MSHNAKHSMKVSTEYTKPCGTVGAIITAEYKDCDYSDVVLIQEAVANALVGLGKAAMVSKSK